MTDDAKPTPTRSIRITECFDEGLNGYVFTDFQHAREWLSQPYVKGAETKLEEVEIGEETDCPFCKGSGRTQVITPIRKLSVEEVLAGAAEP